MFSFNVISMQHIVKFSYVKQEQRGRGKKTTTVTQITLYSSTSAWSVVMIVSRIPNMFSIFSEAIFIHVKNFIYKCRKHTLAF